MISWLYSFVSLFFPRCCIICSAPLARGEECLCTCCNINLPRTNLHHREENPVEQLFWGKVALERATSYLYYVKGSDLRKILHPLKYTGQKDIGEVMGRYMAAELSLSNFFDGIDVIIPVPLHQKKQQQRGYNQSEWIARGVAAITTLAVNSSCVIRKKNTETQTSKTVFQRWENVDGIFCVTQPALFVGKHILLIDDVITTGATTMACAAAFESIEGIRISVLTLAVAG